MSTQEVQCPHCTAKIASNVLFCPRCGTALHEGLEVLQQELVSKPIPDILKQYDSIAQFVEGVAGALFAFYGGVIFAGKVVASFTINAVIYTLPLLLLLVTMGMAVSVLYPKGYLQHEYEELIVIKDNMLSRLWITSSIAGVVFAIAVFVYLTRGTP